MKRRTKQNNIIRGRFNRRTRASWASGNVHSTNAAANRVHQRRSSWFWFIPIWAGAALIGTAYGAGWFTGLGAPEQAIAGSPSNEFRASFGFCHTGGGYNCVVDGDTIWLNGQKIRIADIDAPETHNFRCASEKELGDRATRRLKELLESGSIMLGSIDRDEDRYGRKLRLVLINGVRVGDTLVSEGLARYYGSGRRSWC